MARKYPSNPVPRDRIARAINGSPKLLGAIGEHHFNDVRLGWEPVEYFNGSPGIRYVDGVAYAHYFAQPNTGKPISGTIQNRLAKIGDTFIHGHVQGLLQGNLQYATGRIRHGIVAGSCYLHDEDYRGHANAHWRGVLVLNAHVPAEVLPALGCGLLCSGLFVGFGPHLAVPQNAAGVGEHVA